jgi:hypothetical protein
VVAAFFLPGLLAALGDVVNGRVALWCRFTFNLSLLNFHLALIPSMCHQINRERQIWSSLCTSRITQRRIQQLTFWLIKTRSGLT